MAENEQDLQRHFAGRLEEVTGFISGVHDHARERFAFLAGGEGQWTPDSIQRMRSEKRPWTTLNQIRPTINSVGGAEIVNKMEPRFIARSPSLQDMDGFAAQVWNEVYKWCRNKGHHDSSESRAFRDAATAGVGMTETYMDYDLHPEGVPTTKWVSLFEIGWDPRSKLNNLMDSEYFVRGRSMKRKEVVILFPEKGAEATEQFGNWGDSVFGGFASRSVRDGDYKIANGETGYYKAQTDELLVYDYQRFERESQLRVLAPGMPTSWMKDKDELATFLEQYQVGGGDPNAVLWAPLPRRVYKRSYHCGPIVLDEQDMPFSEFSYKAITGFDDQSNPEKVSWNGIVDDMMDPQRVINKLASQMLYFLSLNPNALVAEEDVIIDRSQFERDITSPNKTVVVRRNALREGRIRDKLGRSPVPSGMFEMFGSMLEMPHRTSGISPFMTGMVGDLRRTAGSAVDRVVSQGLTLLSVMMDSLRLYRQSQAFLVMQLARLFMRSEHVARILSPELKAMGAEQLIYMADVHDYDIIVDEAPISPSAQEQFRRDMVDTGLMANLIELGAPPPPEIFDFFGLPPIVAQAWRESYRMALTAGMGQMVPPGVTPPGQPPA